MSDEWIWVCRWDGPKGFQHYTGRDPIWIKNYTRLLSKDEYVGLSFPQRGLLHGIWLEFPRCHRKLPKNTAKLSRRLSGKVLEKSLQALIDAGFIEIIASDVLAARLQGASPEVEKEVEELSVGESSSSNRSDETQTQRASPNGRAAIDTTEDIPLERSGPHFPCSECAQTFTNWEERQIHLELDHIPDKEHA